MSNILIIANKTKKLNQILDILEGNHDYKMVGSAHKGLKEQESNDYELIVCGMEIGANADFYKKLIKPFVMLYDSENLSELVIGIRAGAKDAIQVSDKKNKILSIVKNMSVDKEKFKIIAEDASTKVVLNSIERIGGKKATIMLLGESGVGKDVIANYIHDKSGRNGNFVAVNCAAIPDGMLESVLFGHKKGSFTGAHKDHKGKFIESSGGTLFLDEVGEMDLDMQAKILRVIETSTVDQIGSSGEQDIDLNIVVATNKDLKKMVDEGKFRLDLYYRLNIITFYIEPLRKRPLDLKGLTNYFVDYYSNIDGNKYDITNETMDAILSYKWPGNIRELKNSIHRATILCDGQITDADLGLQEITEELTTILDRNGGNRKKAAEEMGVSLRTLQYRIKKEGLIGNDGT